MTIRDRDRKILWGRSGNRCAICRRVLVVDATDRDRDAVTGEEAHIVAQAPSGPRGGQLVGDVDAYENLILLCSVDHKRVDDQPLSYDTLRLRQIKSDHESWVASTLDVVRNVSPRLVDLPMRPARLVNRERELAAITEVMERSDETPMPRVVVITGMHGVGKSAVGAHWVMRNWAGFDGGQLVGDFSKRRHGGPVDVSEILGDFLRDLGAAEEAIPATLAARRRMFLDATVSRRLLMLLDDIEHAAQVSAVMPGGAGSMVLVTSNYDLEELLYEGAALVPLDPFDLETSRRLLIDMVGTTRIEEEPDAVDRLIHMCGGLPLALRICGGRLIGPGRTRSVSWLADGIAGAVDRLSALSGSGSYAIDAVFDFAYSDLSADARLVYRRLGLHPGGDLVPGAVAALLGERIGHVTITLEKLRNVHLIETDGDDGYRLHELVGHHAKACADRDDSPAVRDRAVRRLLDWFHAALQSADRAVFESRLRLTDFDDHAARDLPVFESARDAFQWLRRHREVIAAVVRVAVEIGWDERVWQFAEALWPLCYNQKLYSLWFEAYAAGAAAAERLGDDAAEARMRSCLARAYSDQGDFGRAASEMHAADAAAFRCDNDLLKASIAEFGAIMRFERGDVADALARFQGARSLFERAGGERGVAIQNYQIGKCLIALGAIERALEPLEEADTVFAALQDDVIRGRVLRRRAEALVVLRRYVEARAALAAALEIAERLDLPHDEAQSLEVLASVALGEGHADVAQIHRERALRLYQEIGHPRAKSLFNDLEQAGSS